MKIEGPLVNAVFIERPNRFITIIEIGGKRHKSHLPDPGRLKELLATPIENDEDDQFYVQREYLRNPKGIVCDVEQYMFITSDYSVIQRNGQLYN